jgi:predicted site-specific integrase-resolvase
MALVHPILEYGAACWVPCREGQINALDRVQTKVAHITNHTKDSKWEILAQRRTITRLCALFKAYSGERVWKAIRDRLRRP